MKTLKSMLMTIAVLLCSTTVSAHNFEVDGIYYNITSNEDLTVEVTYKGSSNYSGSVEIPEYVVYNNCTYSVTSVGKGAFEDCSGLTSITIPNSVTSIGEAAFYNCSGLTSITIPNSVTSIGGTAFYNCLGFTSITIPNTVTSIGDFLFQSCSGLTSITIPSSVTSIGMCAFQYCSNLINITIPNSVTSIGNDAFDGTPWYEQQSDGVMYVNDVLFEYKGEMPANTSIEIREGTISISPRAFTSCSGLTSITIPNSVTSIGNSAFINCLGLTSITIPNSVTRIGEYAFDGCSGLTNITIPNSVTSIGNYAFQSCSGLTSITIPNSVTNIGMCAFDGTPWYEQQSDGVMYVNDVLFEYKGEMPANTSIEIREGTISISPSAFTYCSGLTCITIPNSVTSIGEYAFQACSGLTSITIPNSVTSIGEYAFQSCSGLTNITIPNSVTSIGNYAFQSCSGLTSITIPNSVTSIGNYAFQSCSGLTSITIPNSVTSIGNYAFQSCSGLTGITIPNSVTSIGNYAFQSCSGLTGITIPNSVTSIGTAMFENCRNLTNVTIPNSVTYIDAGAFAFCTSLKYVGCTSLIPPACHGRAFERVTIAECTLEIPEEAVDAYTVTSPWSGFNIVGVKIPSKITLIDSEAYEVIEDDEFDQITYTRTLPNLLWNALYVPFEIPVSQLVENYDIAYINAMHSYDMDDNGAIDKMEMEVVKIKEGTLHANYPYLIRAKNEEAKAMEIVVENSTLYAAESATVDCSSVFTKFEITGTYQPLTNEDIDGCYALSDGTWKTMPEDATLNPFRLYLRISDREGSPVKIDTYALEQTSVTIRVQGENPGTTSIDSKEIGVKNEESDATIYNLMGQPVKNPVKGSIYIQGGRKVVW